MNTNQNRTPEQRKIQREINILKLTVDILEGQLKIQQLQNGISPLSMAACHSASSSSVIGV